MEHLQWNVEQEAPFRVPFHECPSLPFEGQQRFDTYLDRLGISFDSMVQDCGRSLPLQDFKRLLCLIQNHVYFGFLEKCLDMFQVPLDPQAFISREGSHAWLTTSKIPEYARRIVEVRARDVLTRSEGPISVFDMRNLSRVPTPVLALIGRLDSDRPKAEAFFHQLWSECDVYRHFLRRLTESLLKRRALLLYEDEDYQVILACAVLMQTMENFFAEVFPSVRQESRIGYSINSVAADVQMRLRNWCPNRVAGIVTDPCIGLFMLGMNSHDTQAHGADLCADVSVANKTGQDDRVSRFSLMRKLITDVGSDNLPPCKDGNCIRSVRSSYRMSPSHCCNDHNNCSLLKVNEMDLEGIYSRGGIPVVQVRQSGSQVSLSLIDAAAPESDFCAISHVWSHGLGNSEQNSLPRCQIQRLAALVLDLQPKALLWIDTLCVPVSSSLRATRKIAISRMADIYKTAQNTLVLDKSLEKIQHDPYMMGLQVLCSEWTCRLWTLQEGILPGPGRLAVCFKDQVLTWGSICNSGCFWRHEIWEWFKARCNEINVSLEVNADAEALGEIEKTILTEVRNSSPLSSRTLPPFQIWNPLGRLLRNLLDEFLDQDIHGAQYPGNSLLKISNVVHSRSTSRSTDEYLCIAHLLGLDLSRFSQLPSSMDMILEQTPISGNFMFLPGPRLTRTGFRWAPATLLGQEHVLALLDNSPATLMERGISLAKASLLAINPVKIRERQRYVLTLNYKPIAMFLHSKENWTGTNGPPIKRPSFLLLFDFTRVYTQKRIIRAVLVDRLRQRREDHSFEGRFLFNVILVRTEFLEHISPGGEEIVTIPVEFSEERQWLID